jgi:predicted O-methyltransferase YrrM
MKISTIKKYLHGIANNVNNLVNFNINNRAIPLQSKNQTQSLDDSMNHSDTLVSHWKKRESIKNETPQSLENWIVSCYHDKSFQDLIAMVSQVKDRITPPDELAMMYALIQKIQPHIVLEIGTFFAKTTKLLAEAMSDIGFNGKIITIDPYGEHRVPTIIKTWPDNLQSLVEFKPWNSMQFFLSLEDLHLSKSSLGLIFVDGHHNFEYALFDLVRSADYIQPGGVIVVDNLEQDGPREAVQCFLQRNPAWKLFFYGDIINTNKNLKPLPKPDQSKNKKLYWGALLAPLGIPISSHVFKMSQRNIKERRIKCIRFYVDHMTSPGTFIVNMNYYATPYDFHITGKGIIAERRMHSVNVLSTDKEIDVIFDPPLNCGSEKSDMNISYEMELVYCCDSPENDYLLLNSKMPVVLMSEKSAHV